MVTVIKLYEYEGKKIFAKYAINVSNSVFVSTESRDFSQVDTLKYPCMVKVQIQQGGRGKAGGIKKANSPKEAIIIGNELMDSQIKDEVPYGVLVEEAIEIKQEIYLGITVDDVFGAPILVLSMEGGVEIENIAASNPKALHTLRLNPCKALMQYEAVDFLKSIGITGKLLPDLAAIVLHVEEVFHTYDANLVEINPLIINSDDQLIAGDAKIIIDDYSLFRQNEITEHNDYSISDDAFELRAKKDNYTLVRLGGDIAVVSVGAGYGMAIVDAINHYGGHAANFSDQMAGQSFMRTINGVFEMIKQDSSIKSAVIGFMLSASSLKNVVECLVECISKSSVKIPLHGSIKAASASLLDMDMSTAKQILTHNGVIMYDDIRDAIKNAIIDSKGREAK